jgi:hypothetical protein
LVLVLVVMVFIAGLMLDTTAVLSLAFGWIWRVWKRAPLETSLAAVALIAGTLAVFGRRGAETPEPRERRPKPKSRNVAQPANKRRPAQRARQKAPTETSEPENADAVAADADAGATVQPRKKAARRKSVKADA